jgi:phosphate transport system permease protein
MAAASPRVSEKGRPKAGMFQANIGARRLRGHIFVVVGLLSIALGLGALVILVGDVLVRGWPWLDWQFLNSFDSRFAERAGIKAAIAGTAWMIVFTLLFALPLGIMAAIYLEEYAPNFVAEPARARLRRFTREVRAQVPGQKGAFFARELPRLMRDLLAAAGAWFTGFIEVNISNLAGVPSIIYGLLGLQIFVRFFALERSVWAGSLTMALLVLPIIIVAGREAIRAVPQSIRAASYAVGATRWQTIRNHVLPYAFPGILTGNILAASRAIGETAPLITIGALTFVLFTPNGPSDTFTVLPIVIFNWTSKAQTEFHDLAAAAIVVLLALLLTLNSLAVFLRYRLRRRR